MEAFDERPDSFGFRLGYVPFQNEGHGLKTNGLQIKSVGESLNITL